MKGRTRLALGAVLAVPFAILGFGMVKSELGVADQLSQLPQQLPEKTTLLKTRAAIVSDSGCTGVAAQMLATELSRPQVVEHYSDTPNLIKDQTFVVWPDKTNVGGARADGVGPVTEVPKIVDSLLKQHAFLPEGVRRVVVFTTSRIESRLDPRCW